MQPRRWQPKFDFEFGVSKQNLISMSENLAPDIVRVNDCQIGRIQINQLELACRIHLDFRMTSTELSVSNRDIGRMTAANYYGQLLRQQFAVSSWKGFTLQNQSWDRHRVPQLHRTARRNRLIRIAGANGILLTRGVN